VIIYDGERTTMQDVEIPDEMIGIDVPLKRLPRREAGGAIMRNVVALGAACEVAEFPIENLDSALEKRFADKGQKLVDNNKEAARAGQSYVDEEYDHEFDYDLETTDEDYVLLNGDEAIGMGAIAAGCRFYAGYPITPATDVMTYLTGRIERYGGHVVQAEDELSAINMALGAARGGARSMTATSGPRIDLMTETFGLIATSETPLVICNVMRSGPSTGMPTKQEQGDLNGMLYGGRRGPRFVLAPTTIAECFWKTVEAFNLAEKYQLPVYLTADLSMAVTEQTFTPDTFDMDEVEIDRGFVVDETTIDDHMSESGGFQPHEITDDGISPRASPAPPTARTCPPASNTTSKVVGPRIPGCASSRSISATESRYRRGARGLEPARVRRRRRRHARDLVGVERGSARRGGRSPRRRGGRRAGAFRAVHLPAPGPFRGRRGGGERHRRGVQRAGSVREPHRTRRLGSRRSDKQVQRRAVQGGRTRR